MFTKREIQRLLNHEPITEEWPWSAEESVIEAYYRSICEELCARLSVKPRAEWDHYGSGYASYIDAWFYRDGPEFSRAQTSQAGERYVGLVILFSRLSHYYVAGEGEKVWHEGGGASYLPNFGMVDSIDDPAVERLLSEVENVLSSKRLVRIRKRELIERLPPELRVPTILTDPPYHQFDALFHWED